MGLRRNSQDFSAVIRRFFNTLRLRLKLQQGLRPCTLSLMFSAAWDCFELASSWESFQWGFAATGRNLVLYLANFSTP